MNYHLLGKHNTSNWDKVALFFAQAVYLSKINKVNQKSYLEQAELMTKGTLMETLGIVFTQITETSAVATMPVSPTVHQPLGMLHGGASLALAESIGSMASHLMVIGKGKAALGLEINANHIKSVKSGMVTGVGTLLHKGRKTHVWEILIKDSEGKNLSICRMTNMIIDIN
jgi:uncharacterized protein (TIGR00369 family)